MGFAMVGVGGAATDYRGTALHGDATTTGVGFQRTLINQTDFVMAGGLKLMDERLGVGVSIPISYQSVDLNLNGGGPTDGADAGFGVTVKVGAAYQLNDLLRAGAYFKAPSLRTPTFSTNDFGKLAPPMEVGIGASLISVERLVVSTDVRRLFWDSAEGYGKSDRLNWKNQLVVHAGAQYGNADQPLLNWFILRAGYNYGSEVVRDAFLLELPALPQHHITAGLSIDIGLSMHLNLGTVYGLKASKRDSMGRAAEYTTLSIDLGMSGIFGQGLSRKSSLLDQRVAGGALVPLVRRWGHEPSTGDLIVERLGNPEACIRDLLVRGSNAHELSGRFDRLRIFFVLELAVSNAKLGHGCKATVRELTPDLAEHRLGGQAISPPKVEQSLLVGYACIIVRVEHGLACLARLAGPRAAATRHREHEHAEQNALADASPHRQGS